MCHILPGKYSPGTGLQGNSYSLQCTHCLGIDPPDSNCNHIAHPHPGIDQLDLHMTIFIRTLPSHH